MSRFSLIAIGRLRAGPMHDLCADYARRIKWPLDIHELDVRGEGEKLKALEARKIQEKLIQGAYIFALDERGKSLGSDAFAQSLRRLLDDGTPHIQFIIGGAEGLSPEIRAQASAVLSFGAQTWPHMLARVMILEQIYRAQQILSRHPYHRE